MTRLRRLGLSIMTNFMAQGLSLVLGVVALPVYIRILGETGYGVYSFLLILINYLGFLDLGLNGGIVRFVAEAVTRRDSDRIRRLTGTISRIYLVTGGTGALFLLAGSDWMVRHFLNDIPADLLPGAVLYFQLGAVAFLLNLYNIFLSGLLTAAQKQYLSNSVRFGGDSLRYLAGIGILLAGGGLVGLAITNLVVNSGVLAVLFGLSRRELGTFSLFRPFDRGLFREVFSYSAFLMASTIVGVLAVQANQLVVGYLLPVAALAWYAGSFDTAGKLWLIPKNVLAPVFPLWTEMKAKGEKEKITQILDHSVRFILLVAWLPSLLLLIDADVVLSLWISPGFSDGAAPVFRLILAGVLINSAFYAATPLAYAFDLPATITRFQIGQAILNLAGCFLLIPLYGIAGAGLAFLLSQVVIGPLVLGSVLRKTGLISLTRYLKTTVLPPVLAGLAAGGTGWLLKILSGDDWWTAAWRMGVVSVIFLLIADRWVITRDDRMYIGRYTPLGKWFPKRFPR